MVGWLLMSHPLYTVKLFAKAKWEIRENELVHNECEETTDEYVCNPCKNRGLKTNELQGVFYSRKHSICLQTNWKLGPFLYHQEWLGRCEHTYMWPLLTAKHDREDKQKKELLWFSQRTIMTLALRVLKNLSSSWTSQEEKTQAVVV